ncbi:hypothetical protein CLU93_5539 [Janthinobacterium sp. 35]|uniref:hypothetical protein n=1 Tax=Janthinobacterium sp. 35 TaxID=2035210 RepID=UPI000C1A3724|nr:hypothetical protein [Janthinobacterium sp. 35]PIG25473.1 hypothetical protein CLU93_5539 [Janthinobacterium sp. 35]
MASIDYLDGVLHACAQEQDATRTPAGQAASFDVLMDRAFERRHSDLCTHLTATRTRLKNAHAEVDRLSRTGLFDRFIAGTSLRGAKAELAQRQREEGDAGKAVNDARREFHADFANQTRVIDLQERLDDAARRHRAALHIARRAAAMKVDLARHKTRFSGAPWCISFPSLPSYGTEDEIIGEADRVLDQAQEDLARLSQLLESTRPAAAKASEILRAFLHDSSLARRPAGQYVEQRSRSSLDLLTRTAAVPSLEAQLKACTWPGFFHRRADWLVLWSALQAGVEYNNRADGNAANEGPKASWWCGQWQHAIAQWDRPALAALRLAPEMIGNALFALENSTMESKSGADVLIVLAINDGNSRHCSIVGVQFKRGDENSSVIPLSQSGGTQYDAIARHYRASGGRWHGLYASLQRDGGGLSSVPAVAIETTFVPEQDNISSCTYEVRKKATGSASVDWTIHGESLATALASRLGGAGATFDSIDAAFDWAENNGINKLPTFVLIQAVGESVQALYRAGARLRDLAVRSGQTYELVESLERRLSLGIEPDRPEPQRDTGMER